ncbi:TetR family transcriptional regulator [Georgenia sp. SUBG003]|uniref:TetR family transcriptional regulator n=1 Tax=Georgenia sp. SUBG003 TaxID=1497974 RepID=UPI000B263FDD
MPKIIGGSLAEHRERTRTALFEALSALMGERGFDAISLADIASRAGIGRTAVYNHFPDKESLLLAFIEHETSTYVRSLEESLAEVEEPVEQLRVYVRQQLELAPTYHFAPGPDLREVVSREAVQDLRSHVRQVEALLREILTRAIDAGAIPRPGPRLGGAPGPRLPERAPRPEGRAGPLGLRHRDRGVRAPGSGRAAHRPGHRGPGSNPGRSPGRGPGGGAGRLTAAGPLRAAGSAARRQTPQEETRCPVRTRPGNRRSPGPTSSTRSARWSACALPSGGRPTAWTWTSSGREPSPPPS